MSDNLQRLFSACLLFVWLFNAIYFLTELAPFPNLWYFPLEQRWQWAAVPDAGLKMGWYGKVLIAMGLATGGAVGLWGLLKWGQRQLPAALQDFLAISAMGLTLFTLYYLAHSMAYRVL